MNLVDKNKSIAQSFKATLDRRKLQDCRVFTCKVQKNKLNALQTEQLKMLFVEAKWIYNYLLSKSNEGSLDLFKFDTKNLDTIVHKDKDMNDIEVQLKYIKSSIKQCLLGDIINSIKSLSVLKKKGHDVGHLKFKREYSSINFKQLNITHKFVGRNKIKLQGIKKPLQVCGLEQIKDYEVANIRLLKKNNDYFVAITCFALKKEKIKTNNTVGIDFGCRTCLTLSDGEKINVVIEESERLKRLQRNLSRKKKGSNNYNKLCLKIRKEYQKNVNIKNDVSNKIVHNLLKQNDIIVIQDEQINSWKSMNGRKVQHSILGRVKERLVRNKNVFVLSKWVPTTKLCTNCWGINNDIKLSDRVFKCPTCGSISDRDVHAAQNMIRLYELRNKIGMERTNFKPVDFQSLLLTESELLNQEAVRS